MKRKDKVVPPETAPVRSGFEKRYFIDPAQTETFPLTAANEKIALGAKGALETKMKNEKRDVRIRLRRRQDSIDLLVKVPKEVKIRGNADVPAAQEVLQAEAAPLASVGS